MTHDPRRSVERTPAVGATRVLVVDDEPAVRRAVEATLAEDGYVVLSARSGSAAHDILASTPVDVLIVDLLIPDMRGDVIYYVATALQPHLAGATLFLTGDVTAEAAALIAACHCDSIGKPYRIDDLLRKVGTLAAQSRSASA